MNKYIVTADDYGLCKEVNDAIENLIIDGVLTSTNVLVNFDIDTVDKDLRKKYPGVSVGIHWNVTTGSPVSDVKDIASLVDEKTGKFYSIDEFRKRYHKGLIKKHDLETELRRQYEIFYKLYGTPDYWNTHENSALYPKEFKVFENIALEYRIKNTRNFQRLYIDYDLANGFKRRLREKMVSLFVNYWFGKRTRKNFGMPDLRIVTFVNSSKTDIRRMKKALTSVNDKLIEIIIHPSTNGDNELFGNIGADRVVEFEFYKSAEMKALLTMDGSITVGFDYVSQKG